MIRTAAISDAPAIARVHVASWLSSYRGLLPDDFLESLSETNYTERWKRVITEGTSKVVVAEDGTDVVGFASGGRERAGEQGFEGELYAIYVLDMAQRRGFGRELVRAMVQGLRGLGLGNMIIWSCATIGPRASSTSAWAAYTFARSRSQSGPPPSRKCHMDGGGSMTCAIEVPRRARGRHGSSGLAAPSRQTAVMARNA